MSHRLKGEQKELLAQRFSSKGKNSCRVTVYTFLIPCLKYGLAHYFLFCCPLYTNFNSVVRISLFVKFKHPVFAFASPPALTQKLNFCTSCVPMFVGDGNLRVNVSLCLQVKFKLSKEIKKKLQTGYSTITII